MSYELFKSTYLPYDLSKLILTSNKLVKSIRSLPLTDNFFIFILNLTPVELICLTARDYRGDAKDDKATSLTSKLELPGIT